MGLVGGLFCALCWFIGIINAIQGIEKEVPPPERLPMGPTKVKSLYSSPLTVLN